MGLLYEMVLKKRQSALLMQKQDNWKQRFESNVRNKLALAVQLPESGSKQINKQN